MRYKLKPKIKLNEGDVRVVKGFLLIPRYISREWRWLEHAERGQVVRLRSSTLEGARCEWLGWVDVSWITP